MQDDLNIEMLDTPELTEKQPVRGILIVLAVFTFINAAARICGTLMVFYVVSLFNRSDEMDDEGRWAIAFLYALLISAVINIVGAIMMLRRKKSGYIVYVAGQVVFLLGLLALFFSLTREIRNDELEAAVFFLAAFILPVLVAVLYYFASRSRVTNN